MSRGKLVFVPLVRDSLTSREARALIALAAAGWPQRTTTLRGAAHPRHLARLNEAKWSITARELRAKGLYPPRVFSGGVLLPREVIPRVIQHFQRYRTRRPGPFLWEVLAALEEGEEEAAA
ncbi:MAG TPA: hypothetical protein ENJ40_07975 [Thermosulfurimonas dismutans]|uniref:Uncharacterized protein n=1 Tax=Thermosulfurimonas dismutans TaxID=999894 RepID=A0A7C3CT14_9BACT|nr:hypothetical protein [Thermosulfurimonas dismutans]